jgi:hypothetical protein
MTTPTEETIMTTPILNKNLHRRAVAAMLALAGMAPLSAWCDDLNDQDFNPVRPDEVLGLAVSQDIRYDNNVFRLPDGNGNTATSDAGQRHDFISVTTVRAGLDKHFGRHRLLLLAAPSIVNYVKFNQFDYVGQEFLADWSGRLGTDGWYGTKYEHSKVATDPADQVVPIGNRATRDTVGAELGLPIGPRWQAVTNWHADKNRNSADTEKSGDNDGWAADGGVRYVPATGNNIDLRYRRSHYNYPNVIPTLTSDNTYTQNEIELSGLWQINEPSRLEGRASYVKREHENISQRDFSGWVGSLKYIWKPTVSTGASLHVFRDLGAVNDASASYADTWGVDFQPTWTASTKLAFGSLLAWQRRSYNGFTLQPRAAENIARVGLNARYMATRNWQFDIGISDEHRYSSDPLRKYSDVMSSVTAQWKM